MKKVYLRLYDYGDDVLFTIADNETKRSVAGVVELKPNRTEYQLKGGVKAWAFQSGNGFSEDLDTYSNATRIK